MTRKKIHIDELFRNGLKSLSLFVSNKDLEAIDDKKSVFKDPQEETKSSLFKDFELEITENDWMATKAKLDIEKSVMAQDNIFHKGMDGFEMDILAEDWPITYQKYKNRKKRRIAFFWLGTGVFFFLTTLSIILLNIGNDESLISAKGKMSADSNSETPIPKTNQIEEIKNTPLESSENNNELGHSNTNENKNTPAPESKIKVEINAVNANSKSGIPASEKPNFVKRMPMNGFKQVPNMDQNKPLEPTAEKALVLEENTTRENHKEEIQSSGNLNSTNENQSNEINTEKIEQSEMSEQKPVLEDKNTGNSSASENKSKVEPDLMNKLDTPENKENNLKVIKPFVPSLGLYAAVINQISMSHRVLSSKNDQVYNSIRNSGEKPSIQWTKGFEIGIQKSNYQISMGVQTTTQTWSTQYSYNYRIFDSLPVWNPGRTQIIGYLLVRGRDTFINERSVVKIQKIQLPLQYNRMFKINDKMKLIAGGSVLLDWNIKTEGSKILKPQNKYLYNYAALKQNERSFNLMPSIQIGMQNSLNKRFQLQTSLNGGMSMYSRFKTEFGAGDYPYNFGINIKLLYLIK